MTPPLGYEVPIAGFSWLFVWTALASAQGDLNTAGGWATVGLAALTTAGLAVIAWRGLQARPVLAQAMEEALGVGWPSAIDPELAARRRRRLPLARILLLPLWRRRRDVERVADIAYGDAGRRNLLDLYRHRARPPGRPGPDPPARRWLLPGPQEPPGPAPALPAGQPRLALCQRQLPPAARRPAPRPPARPQEGDRLGACPRPPVRRRPGLLLVSGSSAGAHLAALAALTPDDPAFQPGFEDADTSVTAAIGLNGWYGGYHGQEDASSPLAGGRPEAPPFFIAHGDHDTVAPVELARDFAATLGNLSTNPVVYAELPRFEMVVDTIQAFAAWRGRGLRAAEA